MYNRFEYYLFIYTRDRQVSDIKSKTFRPGYYDWDVSS